MFTWLQSVFSGRRTSPPRSRFHGRAIPQLEHLDERIVPAGPTIDYWTNGAGTGLWSNAGNWSDGLPTVAKTAVFDSGRSTADCKYDNTVATANQVVGGLWSLNGYAGKLSLMGGFSLTVQATADASAGFQWATNANIWQSTAGDVLIITGGTTNNVWSNGTVNNNSTQSNLYINGGSTLQITGSASALGDNIIIGQDSHGGSTLDFYYQTSASSGLGFWVIRLIAES